MTALFFITAGDIGEMGEHPVTGFYIFTVKKIQNGYKHIYMSKKN